MVRKVLKKWMKNWQKIKPETPKVDEPPKEISVETTQEFLQKEKSSSQEHSMD